MEPYMTGYFLSTFFKQVQEYVYEVSG